MHIHLIDTINLDAPLSDHIPNTGYDRITVHDLLAQKMYDRDMPAIYMAYCGGYMQYIGQTRNLYQRFKRHIKTAKWITPKMPYDVGTWLAVFICLYQPSHNQRVWLTNEGKV